MNLKNRNAFWGVVFLLGAVLILLGRLDLFAEINMTRLLLALLLLYAIARNARSLNFYGILIPAACICILYDNELHLTALTPFPVLAAAVFGSIGLSFLFPPKQPFSRNISYGGSCRDEKDRCFDSDISCSVSFAGTSKYMDTDDFRKAFLKCSFGSLKAYFDHAKIAEDSASIYMENLFGDISLFLPKDWNVTIDVAMTFGDIEEIRKPPCPPAGAPAVLVSGTVSFGDCKIYYI